MLQGQDFVKFMKVMLGIAPAMGQVINLELEERHWRGSLRPCCDAFPSHPSLSARRLNCRLACAPVLATQGPRARGQTGHRMARDRLLAETFLCAYFVTVCFPHENTFLIKTENLFSLYS